MQEALFDGLDASHIPNPNQSVEKARLGQARMRLADRSQVGMHLCSIDELVAPDHQVRVIWDAVCQMDLSAFEASIRAREFTEGRPANDVRVMVGLWLWAARNNVARGRRLEGLCKRDLSFIWMCGGLGVNYHSLNDFRVDHQAALDELFTATLEKYLAEAEAHLAELKKQADLPDNSNGDEDEQKNSPEMAIAIDRAAEQQVNLYMPVPQPNKNSKVKDRFEPREDDSQAVAQWRQRMSTEAAKEIDEQRAATIETVNADVRTYRGMSPFSVRGISKTNCVALWSALACNLMHFAWAFT